MSGTSSPAQIADRIETALARIERATQLTSERLQCAERRAALLEQHGQEALAALDALLATAAER